MKVATPAGPEQGVTVVFSDAEGTPITTGTTDASGQVVQTVPSGSMVTALLGGWTSDGGSMVTPKLVTFVGVETGDVLKVLDTTSLARAPAVQTWDLTGVPTSMAPGGAPTYFQVYGPCATNSFPLVQQPTPAAPMQGTCAWAGPFPILIAASQLGMYDEIVPLGGFVFSKTTVDPTDGGAFPRVSFGSAPWIATIPVTVELSNLGAVNDVQNVEANHYEYSVGYPFADQVTQINTDVDAGTQTLSFPGYPGLADFVQTEASSNGGFIARRDDTLASTVTLDFSQSLPRILSAGVDTLSSPGRPVVVWTPLASLASSADGTYVTLNYGSWTWTFLVPPGATRLQAPALPTSDAAASAWAPDPSWTFFSSGLLVAAIDSDGVSGYAAFRAAGTSLLPRSASQSAPLPVAGTLRATTFGN